MGPDPSDKKVTEEQLVKDLQAGKTRSFEQLANLYQKKIYALSFNLTRNITDSQDVTQEVLLTLFRKGHTFQGKSAFSELGIPNHSQCLIYETPE